MSNDPNETSTSAGAVPDLQSQASTDLNKITEEAKRDLDAVTHRAGVDAQKLGEQAKAKVDEATDEAKSFATDQKDLAAKQINGVAAAITKVADELNASEQQSVARYARDLASGLSSVGQTIENKGVDDLMGIAQDFGRKQPVAFLGVAALAGFAASRFALASSHRRASKPSEATQSADTATSQSSESGNTGRTRMGGL